VVLVTHFMEEAQTLCDRVAIVDKGRVVALDRPDTLTARHGGPITMTFAANGYNVGFLSAVPGIKSVSTTNGVVTVAGQSQAAVPVAAALAERRLFPADFRTHHPTLEDVFLATTGRQLRD
jgi:ABC-2 type transport system ATP-binding protein